MLVDNGSANFSHWNINYSYQKFQILLFSVHCDLNSLILRESKIFDHNNTQFRILNSQRVNFFTNFFSNLAGKVRRLMLHTVNFDWHYKFYKAKRHAIIIITTPTSKLTD